LVHHKMCGIFAALYGIRDISGCSLSCQHNHLQPDWRSRTRTFLQNRGPDSFGTRHFSFSTTLELEASVLSLRGGKVIEQPLEDSSGNFLLFNGEIYNACEDENDTLWLSKLLGQVVSRHRASGRESLKPLYTEILELLDSLHGPWSFIYFISSLSLLIFGRDKLGRRSLLFGKTGNDGTIFISSVAPQDSACSDCLIELAPLGLYSIEWEQDSTVCKLDWHCRNGRTMDSLLDDDSLPRGAPKHCLFLNSYIPDKWWRKMPNDVVDTSSCLVHQWLHVLYKAVGRRIEMLQLPNVPCPSLPFALLFSGGIDSLVLACLMYKVCQSHEKYRHQTLDLINVCFGPPHKSPDRKTAIEGVEELNRICSDVNHPTGAFRLVLVNVDKEEYQKYRQHVKYLLCPCNTPMDMSLGSTLWFGARAQGHVKQDNDMYPYTSSCKVLFSGLGADELLGGYKKRHRAAFQRGGYSSLADELNKDLSRIWWRNLGRDDRVVADHGKELRLAFLDEQVVDFITSLPLS